jgi:hypothetical protein
MFGFFLKKVKISKKKKKKKKDPHVRLSIPAESLVFSVHFVVSLYPLTKGTGGNLWPIVNAAFAYYTGLEYADVWALTLQTFTIFKLQ